MLADEAFNEAAGNIVGVKLFQWFDYYSFSQAVHNNHQISAAF
jgi:hypothetical protein